MTVGGESKVTRVEKGLLRKGASLKVRKTFKFTSGVKSYKHIFYNLLPTEMQSQFSKVKIQNVAIQSHDPDNVMMGGLVNC